MGVFGSPHPRAMTVPTSGSAGTFPRIAANYVAPGVVVPFGALDTWWQFTRGESGIRRGEVVIFGDSTTFGSGGLYSWVTRLRSRAVAAGWSDGGKGIFGYGDDQLTYDAGEVVGVVTNNFTDVADNYDILQGAFLTDNGTVAGKTTTLQFNGSSARIWYRDRFDSGDFTYAVDGGSPVTVRTTGAASSVVRFVYLSGLNPATTHTVVITNLDGRAAIPPTGAGASIDGNPGGGTYGAGTFYYVITGVTAGGGETVAGAVQSCTNGANTNVSVVFFTNGLTSYKLYRGTSSSGPFDLASVSPTVLTPSAKKYTLDGATTFDSATHPPVTGTTQLNTSAAWCYVALAPMFDVGFTVQKQAVSGATFTNFFMGSGVSPSAVTPYTMAWTNMRTAQALGLNEMLMGGPDYSAGLTVDTGPTTGKVKPVLAIAHLGFNDLSGTGFSVDPLFWTEYVKRFAAECKAASVSGVIVSGQLPYNASWPASGAACYNALKAQALASGLAFVDLFYPIGGDSLSYAGGTQNPHLTKAQYQAQGDFLWDNLLGVA